MALLLSVTITLLVSSMLGKTILKGEASSFTLELPPYRKPQFAKVIVRSILDRTIFVLGRAISVSIPAGALIWLLQNITVADSTLLSMFSNMLEPLGSIMGLSGAILAAFLLGIPANEIVIPILLMYYSQSGMLVESSGITELGEILRNNGWTIITALCAILFSLNHFPCATTLWTIAKETKSIKWTSVSFLLPTLVGIIICVLINITSKLFL
ncbi:nucleoside recognition domain-containing protein [Clostridium sp. MD294]|uniref:nucleoside recognition domain-containing protein n=1 Tax=Clostridium sp. MD294 TaxID=97138 RepID=UPI00138F5343|nr:nucleoside recognition domain-containing protein [Clostridium sp. MD294]